MARVSKLLVNLAVSIGIGTILLLLLTRLIAGIRLSFGIAFGASFIAHVAMYLSGFGMGFLFGRYLVTALNKGPAFMLMIFVEFCILAVTIQVVLRATGNILRIGKACVLSFSMLVVESFVAPPLTAWLMALFTI